MSIRPAVFLPGLAVTGTSGSTPTGCSPSMNRLSILSFVAGLAAAVRACGGEPIWPDPDWPRATPAEAGMDAAGLTAARDYALTGGGAGCVIRGGRLVLDWGDTRQLFDLKSSTKAIGVTALGLALADGRISLDDPAAKYHPSFGVPPAENAANGRTGRVTLRMLAGQTAGFEKPGGFGKLLFDPGTMWHYSDGGPNWLADCLTLAYRRDLDDLLFERVFSPIGIGRDDLRWRRNAYRPAEIDGVARREFGSGISANIRAMSRIGYLYLRGGTWKGRELFPRGFVDLVRRAPPGAASLHVLEPPEPGDRFGAAPAHYGLLWWNNNDGTLEGVPRDAYWSWGLYDSLIVVIPGLDLVVARAGKSWARRAAGGHYDVLQPFLGPICAAVRSDATPAAAAAPAPSSAIRNIRWAPADTIIRLAPGSDNWPTTWAGDDALYTAYGDGRGFAPFVAEKLSLGFARVTGLPPDLRGENLRAATLEARGYGPHGRKASGLLCVAGVLHLLARNDGNARLARSTDHGTTWTWTNWRLEESFGCPTFVQFGRDYAGARDDFVYLVSPDRDDAYRAADRMVLARVPKTRIHERAVYEFFVRRGDGGHPKWTSDIARRGGVLLRSGGCRRSGVSYCAGLRRYLWCVPTPGDTPNRRGGLAIYEAPEPWGPWSVVFETDAWDVPPGESASFPTKWMSADGRTLHLLFSGNDGFAVRRAVLEIACPAAP